MSTWVRVAPDGTETVVGTGPEDLQELSAWREAFAPEAVGDGSHEQPFSTDALVRAVKRMRGWNASGA